MSAGRRCTSCIDPRDSPADAEGQLALREDWHTYLSRTTTGVENEDPVKIRILRPALEVSAVLLGPRRWSPHVSTSLIEESAKRLDSRHGDELWPAFVVWIGIEGEEVRGRRATKMRKEGENDNDASHVAADQLSSRRAGSSEQGKVRGEKRESCSAISTRSEDSGGTTDATEICRSSRRQTKKTSDSSDLDCIHIYSFVSCKGRKVSSVDIAEIHQTHAQHLLLLCSTVRWLPSPRPVDPALPEVSERLVLGGSIIGEGEPGRRRDSEGLPVGVFSSAGVSKWK